MRPNELQGIDVYPPGALGRSDAEQACDEATSISAEEADEKRGVLDVGLTFEADFRFSFARDNIVDRVLRVPDWA
jgi:hypothetical protein